MNNVHEGSTEYTLTYDANGGVGGPVVASKMGNEYYAIFTVDTTEPTKTGFVFMGWSSAPEGEVELSANDVFTVTAKNKVLYAVWAKEGAVAVAGTESEEANTEPLGVVATSQNEEGLSFGAVFGPSLIVIALVAALVSFVILSRQPKILSKEYEEK